MNKYKLSFDFAWHIENGYGWKVKEKQSCERVGFFKDKTEAYNDLRKDIIDQLNEISEVVHIRNGIVIAGMDENYNDIIVVTHLTVEDEPLKRYGVLYDSEDYCDLLNKFYDIEEAKRSLEFGLDAIIENACEEGNVAEVEWDSDGLGFCVTAYTQDDEYQWESTCRIVELDECENYIEED